jgi:hypothetical protein
MAPARQVRLLHRITPPRRVRSIKRRPGSQLWHLDFAFRTFPPTIHHATLKTFLRKFWSILALLAGAALIYFEWKRAGGITADNIFWLIIAALIVILALINLIQKPGDHSKVESDINSPLH